ncbi:hypothetical protein ACS0TY_004663 [Phlomoides rotata]
MLYILASKPNSYVICTNIRSKILSCSSLGSSSKNCNWSNTRHCSYPQTVWWEVGTRKYNIIEYFPQLLAVWPCV